MSLLRYKAVDAQGKMHTGRVEVDNDADLEMRLAHMGLHLIRYKEVGPKTPHPENRPQGTHLILFSSGTTDDGRGTPVGRIGRSA